MHGEVQLPRGDHEPGVDEDKPEDVSARQHEVRIGPDLDVEGKEDLGRVSLHQGEDD